VHGSVLGVIGSILAAQPIGGNPPRVADTVAPAPPETDQIILRADDRFRGANLRTRVDRFICPNARIVVTTFFHWVAGRGEWRLHVGGIMINERTASATALTELNRVLASFERPPEVEPLCNDGRLRLTVTRIEPSRRPRREVVNIGGDR
jgi:hypothetical protein